MDTDKDITEPDFNAWAEVIVFNNMPFYTSATERKISIALKQSYEQGLALGRRRALAEAQTVLDEFHDGEHNRNISWKGVF